MDRFTVKQLLIYITMTSAVNFGPSQFVFLSSSVHQHYHSIFMHYAPLHCLDWILDICNTCLFNLAIIKTIFCTEFCCYQFCFQTIFALEPKTGNFSIRSVRPRISPEKNVLHLNVDRNFDFTDCYLAILVVAWPQTTICEARLHSSCQGLVQRNLLLLRIQFSRFWQL